MPSNFNEAATTGVGEAVHAYLANTAIADWYTVTNKADAEQYYALANKNMELIRQTVSKRSRPTRPSDNATGGTTDDATSNESGDESDNS